MLRSTGSRGLRHGVRAHAFYPVGLLLNSFEKDSSTQIQGFITGGVGQSGVSSIYTRYRPYTPTGAALLDAEIRYRWLATHIFPCEGEVRSWLRKHVRTLSPADFDDLLQEAYARIWETDFARVTNPRGYFYTIVRNLLLEQARRARIIPLERMAEIEALRGDGDPGPERRVSARQELEYLCRIIGALPAKCRQAFELRTFEGCSRSEIGERMGISHRTVEKHLIKAYLRVGEAMGRDADGPPAHDTSARNSEHDASR